MKTFLTYSFGERTERRESLITLISLVICLIYTLILEQDCNPAPCTEVEGDPFSLPGHHCTSSKYLCLLVMEILSNLLKQNRNFYLKASGGIPQNTIVGNTIGSCQEIMIVYLKFTSIIQYPGERVRETNRVCSHGIPF